MSLREHTIMDWKDKRKKKKSIEFSQKINFFSTKFLSQENN